MELDSCAHTRPTTPDKWDNEISKVRTHRCKYPMLRRLPTATLVVKVALGNDAKTPAPPSPYGKDARGPLRDRCDPQWFAGCSSGLGTSCPHTCCTLPADDASGLPNWVVTVWSTG